MTGTRILDTAPSFDRFAAAAALESPFIREQMWRELYQAAHAEVFSGLAPTVQTARLPSTMVRELARVRRTVRAAAAALTPVLETVDALVRDTLGAPDAPSPLHVLVVGDGSINATVGRVGEDVAVFHFLEWFRSADISALLAGHEGAHAWHEIILGNAGPSDDVAWTLFSEGLAIRTSRATAPDRPEPDYFWYGHRGFVPWVAWCREHRTRLRKAVRERLDDPASLDQLFGGISFEDHIRVGYFVADDVVGSLSMPLAALAHLTVAEAREAVVRQLDAG